MKNKIFLQASLLQTRLLRTSLLRTSLLQASLILLVFNNLLQTSLLATFKIVNIKSISQKVVGKDRIALKGDVEVLIDQSIHMWADSVEFDNKKKTILADGSIIFENNDGLILADTIFIDLDSETGYVDNLRLHLKDGFLSAKKAEKIGDRRWRFKKIVYTACDNVHPHWKLKVSEAIMKKNVIYIYNFPIFKAPMLAASSEDQSNSGLMLPKLSYSKKFGPGIIQGYYWELSKNIDTTFGFNWKKRKGIVLYDEFRHATGLDEYTLINANYARDLIDFPHKDRVWVSGNHFNTIKSNDLEVNNLIRLDLGTDKRIDYDFFYNSDGIEDQFENDFISRFQSEENIASISVGHKRIFRENFFNVTDSSIIDQSINDDRYRKEDSYRVYNLPRVEWNSSYFPLGLGFHYKNDIFIDEVISRKRSFNTFTNQDFASLGFDKAETIRLYYQGRFSNSLKLKENVLSFNIDPNIQVRSRVNGDLAKRNVFEQGFSAEGAYRAFCKAEVEWAMPESVSTADQYTHYLQPVFKWEYVPKFKQSHWYNSDVWDREYAKNEVSFRLRNDWYVDSHNIGLNVVAAIDFYSREDLFPLRRSPYQKYFLPFKLEGYWNTENCRLNFSQDYDFHGELLESLIDFGFTFNGIEMYLGLVYQTPKLQVTRELLSDVPSFANLGIRLPIRDTVCISYDSQFYSPSNSMFGILKSSDALLHRVKFDYKGHCYGFSFGFEEQRFRKNGNVKSEQSFFLSFKLDSIGSFAHHFRKEPEILRTRDY